MSPKSPAKLEIALLVRFSRLTFLTCDYSSITLLTKFLGLSENLYHRGTQSLTEEHTEGREISPSFPFCWSFLLWFSFVSLRPSVVKILTFLVREDFRFPQSTLERAC